MRWAIRSRIGKMYSSTKQTTIIMYQDLCWLISSLGLLILFKMAHILSCTTLRTYSYPNKAAGPATTGQAGTHKLKKCSNKLSIWLTDKQMVQIVCRDLLSFIQLQVELEVDWVVSYWKDSIKSSLRKSYQPILFSPTKIKMCLM